MIYPEGPIIACSTGLKENTAIAVIRLSGFDSLSDLQVFFDLKFLEIKPKVMYRSNLLRNNTVLDNIMFAYFKAPNSYTGENLLELFVHGNQLNIKNVIDAFTYTKFARDAYAGEFTYRALINNKMTLSQVEGLDLLLNANSNLMLSQGLNVLQGDLFTEYLELHTHFLDLKAALEISIDFSEDVGEEESIQIFDQNLKVFKEKVTSLYDRTRTPLGPLFSPKVVLIGQANAGKSSLFNYFVKEARSIVSEEEGTTRDYISELLFIDGTHYRLIDTAGIRGTNNQIEKEGIKRSLHLIENAFYKILVVNPFDFSPLKMSELEMENEFDLVVFTHADIEGFESAKEQIEIIYKYKNSLNLSLLESGPMGPLRENDGSIGPEKSAGFDLKSGPIEPKKSDRFNLESGPIEPKESDRFNLENGPIGPKDSKQFNLKSDPIESEAKLKNLSNSRINLEDNSGHSDFLKKNISENFKSIHFVKGKMATDIESYKDFHVETGPTSEKSGNSGPMGPESTALKSGSIGPIEKLISNKYNKIASENPLLIGRHREVIGEIYRSLGEFETILQDNREDLAIIDAELSKISNKVEQLIGIIRKDEVLQHIFSNFCIGK